MIGVLTQYDVDGYYFVLKPLNDFLVKDDIYIYSLLDAFISLNLANKEIIVGYANQQDLIFASCGVKSIASGNYRNVRSFNPEDFLKREDQVRTRISWFYDGNTLSEYRKEELILAQRRGLLDFFGPSCIYCENLLKDPTSVFWSEGNAFKHFLFEINRQWCLLKKEPVSMRIDAVIEMFERANENLNELERKGLRRGDRTFNTDVMEPTLNALYAIKTDRKEDFNLLQDI